MRLFVSKTILEKLFISFRISYYCCFGFKGNLEFPDFLQKGFITSRKKTFVTNDGWCVCVCAFAFVRFSFARLCVRERAREKFNKKVFPTKISLQSVSIPPKSNYSHRISSFFYIKRLRCAKLVSYRRK